MAKIADRKPENIAGRFYVDTTCIDCGLCREIASAVFRLDEETGQSFVYRQPEVPDEISLAREAVETCPTESIGDDAS